jgi:hypothetical protein
MMLLLCIIRVDYHMCVIIFHRLIIWLDDIIDAGILCYNLFLSSAWMMTLR